MWQQRKEKQKQNRQNQTGERSHTPTSLFISKMANLQPHNIENSNITSLPPSVAEDAICIRPQIHISSLRWKYGCLYWWRKKNVATGTKEKEIDLPVNGAWHTISLPKVSWTDLLSWRGRKVKHISKVLAVVVWSTFRLMFRYNKKFCGTQIVDKCCQKPS